MKVEASPLSKCCIFSSVSGKPREPREPRGTESKSGDVRNLLEVHQESGTSKTRIIIRGGTVTGGTGLDTYQICIRFDKYQIPFLVKKIHRKTLKTCTEHSVALDARART